MAKTFKFAVGDKVRCIKEPWDAGSDGVPSLVGKSGEVIAIDPDDGTYEVKVLWEDWSIDDEPVSDDWWRSEWWVSRNDIEHDVPHQFIVSELHEGRLFPSHRPAIYGNREDAEKEAKRLAELKLKDFAVLKVVSFATKPVVPAATLTKVS